MLDNNKKSDNRQTLERQFQMADSVFQSKVGASDNSHKRKNGSFHKPPIDNSEPVCSVDDNNFFGVVQTNIISALQKQEMATVKIGWFLFNCFGFSITAYSWVMAYIKGDDFKAWTLFFFGLVFLVIEGLRRYEIYRSKKIENDEVLYGIKRKHEKDAKGNQP